jgi:hypothetical protein
VHHKTQRFFAHGEGSECSCSSPVNAMSDFSAQIDFTHTFSNNYKNTSKKVKKKQQLLMFHEKFYPHCFPDRKIFVEWLYWAKVAKEVASPCHDCPPEYEARMVSQSRCQKEFISTNFLVNKK